METAEQIIERLTKENASLKSAVAKIKVSPKGAVSVYGLQRWPVTLYSNQWQSLLAMAPEIQNFITENADKLSVKS